MRSWSTAQDDLARRPRRRPARARARRRRATEPAPERWFTGVGAAAEHASTLTLVNPDKGPAVADVTVWDGSGLVDVPALRGLRVPGGRSASFDLAEVAPSRDALALRSRSPAAGSARAWSTWSTPSGATGPVREWLPAQAAPAATSYVVGVGDRRAAGRFLTLANPGDSEVRVELKLVGRDSEFAPAGVEELSARPGVGAGGRPRPGPARPDRRGRPGAAARGDRSGHGRACARRCPTTWRSRWPVRRVDSEAGARCRQGQAPRRDRRDGPGCGDAAGLGRRRRASGE